jgi:preprotein translocase subunit SecE
VNKYIAMVLGLGAAAVHAASNAVATTASQAAAGTSPVSKAASSPGFWDQYGSLIIWVVVILALFLFLWSKGYLVKIRNYVEETKEELRKCSWPSVDELKGSTIVVMLTIALLGAFTVGVDWVLSMVVRLITA